MQDAVALAGDPAGWSDAFSWDGQRIHFVFHPTPPAELPANTSRPLGDVAAFGLRVRESPTNTLTLSPKPKP